MTTIELKKKEFLLLNQHVEYLLNNSKSFNKLAKGHEKEIDEAIGKMNEHIKAFSTSEDKAELTQASVDLRNLIVMLFVESNTKNIQYPLGRTMGYFREAKMKIDDEVRLAYAIENEEEKKAALAAIGEETISVNVFQIKSEKVEDLSIEYTLLKPLVDFGVIVD